MFRVGTSGCLAVSFASKCYSVLLFRYILWSIAMSARTESMSLPDIIEPQFRGLRSNVSESKWIHSWTGNKLCTNGTLLQQISMRVCKLQKLSKQLIAYENTWYISFFSGCHSSCHPTILPRPSLPPAQMHFFNFQFKEQLFLLTQSGWFDGFLRQNSFSKSTWGACCVTAAEGKLASSSWIYWMFKCFFFYWRWCTAEEDWPVLGSEMAE